VCRSWRVESRIQAVCHRSIAVDPDIVGEEH
jgi:hypothetical protein